MLSTVILLIRSHLQQLLSDIEAFLRPWLPWVLSIDVPPALYSMPQLATGMRP